MSAFGSTGCLARSVALGYETYSFGIKREWFFRSVSEEKSRPGSLKSWLAIYVLPGRWSIPKAAEIDRVDVAEDDSLDGKVKVTLTIRRGHWVMLDFLKKHVTCGGFTTHLSGVNLVARCACGEMEILEARSVR